MKRLRPSLPNYATTSTFERSSTVSQVEACKVVRSRPSAACRCADRPPFERKPAHRHQQAREAAGDHRRASVLAAISQPPRQQDGVRTHPAVTRGAELVVTPSVREVFESDLQLRRRDRGVDGHRRGSDLRRQDPHSLAIIDETVSVDRCQRRTAACTRRDRPRCLAVGTTRCSGRTTAVDSSDGPRVSHIQQLSGDVLRNFNQSPGEGLPHRGDREVSAEPQRMSSSVNPLFRSPSVILYSEPWL